MYFNVKNYHLFFGSNIINKYYSKYIVLYWYEKWTRLFCDNVILLEMVIIWEKTIKKNLVVVKNVNVKTVKNANVKIANVKNVRTVNVVKNVAGVQEAKEVKLVLEVRLA